MISYSCPIVKSNSNKLLCIQHYLPECMDRTLHCPCNWETYLCLLDKSMFIFTLYLKRHFCSLAADKGT